MKTLSKEESMKVAKELFTPDAVTYQGQGFYRYSEKISEQMISRKGLEREASEFFGVELVLVTRHDVEDSLLIKPKERVAILQLATEYAKDEERSTIIKAKKLKEKYSN